MCTSSPRAMCHCESSHYVPIVPLGTVWQVQFLSLGMRGIFFSAAEPDELLVGINQGVLRHLETMASAWLYYSLSSRPPFVTTCELRIYFPLVLWLCLPPVGCLARPGMLTTICGCNRIFRACRERRVARSLLHGACSTTYLRTLSSSTAMYCWVLRAASSRLTHAMHWCGVES